MSDPFKKFVEEMARLAVPEDDTEVSRGRREAAASESGTAISEIDECDIVACADDEFLCSEALALWAMIRKARELVMLADKDGDGPGSLDRLRRHREEHRLSLINPTIAELCGSTPSEEQAHEEH